MGKQEKENHMEDAVGCWITTDSTKKMGNKWHEPGRLLVGDPAISVLKTLLINLPIDSSTFEFLQLDDVNNKLHKKLQFFFSFVYKQILHVLL